jgi:hypothetical protein
MKANLLALASCTVLCATLACKKDPAKEAAKPGAAAPVAAVAGSDPLRLLPQESSFVGGISFDPLRKGKLWSSLTEARESDPKGKQEYEDFKTRTGWDPFATLSSVLFALSADVDTSKEFGLIVTSTAPVDEKKLVAYLEAKAKEEKGNFQTAQHQGKTLYGSKEKNTDVWFFFLDDKTLGAGGPKWVRKIVELSAGSGAGVDKNAKLMGLVGRANRSAVVWLAGDVPADKGATPVGITIKSLIAALDFPANGFKLDATTTTATPEEGKKLADLATQQLAQIKPLAAGMGLTAVLDSLKVQQTAADVSFGVSLTEPQLEELVTKGKQMAAGMMAGMGGAAAADQAHAGGGRAKAKGKGKGKDKHRH